MARDGSTDAGGALVEEAPVVVLDRAYLARFTLGNLDLEREVLGLFAAQAPAYLKHLAEAETALAWKEAAHTLKGAAAGLGLRRVAQVAAAAERDDPFRLAETEARTRAQASAVQAVAPVVDEALATIRRITG